MATRTLHYVEFISPGTLFSETSLKPIPYWDTAAACEMANGITERHGAKPYGFRFLTRIEADDVPDGQGGMLKVEPKTTKTGPIHYLGGRVILFDEVPESEGILRSNMRCNRHPVIIENTNSYRFTTFFGPENVIVGPDGAIVRRGDDADLIAYRERKNAEFDEELSRYRSERAATNV